MNTYVFDIETDGLDPSLIHCLSYHDVKTGEEATLTSYEGMREFLTSCDTLIGHNIVSYDIPVLEKLLGVTIDARLIDTLGLSWALFGNRPKHGLEHWGTTFKVEKPKITDWEGLTIEEYSHRCERDVQINTKVYNYCMKKLGAIYKKRPELLQRYIDHITFKMDCMAEQQQLGWRVDIPKCEAMVSLLEGIVQEKKRELAKHMPMSKVYSTHTKPQITHKNDGTLSKAGERWFTRLREHKLPMTHKEPVKFVSGEEYPNPGSPLQVKDWLFSLGWKPRTFDYKKNEDGSEREIPQVRVFGELCDSVLELTHKHPEVKELEGLTVAQHRLAIFNNFIKFSNQGRLVARSNGLTNTLRFCHANPLVNLPGVDKAYGKDVRGALVANQGELLCGADLSSLEATTKAHFIFPYDPEYALELTKEDFDEHLDLAVQAGALSNEDYRYYQENDGGDKWAKIHGVRKKFKPVNYSAVYGIGAPKLSRSLESTKEYAQGLLDAYWERNAAVKQMAAKQEYIYLKNGEMWLYNPVAKMYYSLRYEKDIFSTLNQGTGAYVFDTWVKHCRSMGVRFCGQFHDEHISPVPVGNEEEHEKKLQQALDKTNEELRLNVKVGMDCQFGPTYADIH